MPSLLRAILIALFALATLAPVSAMADPSVKLHAAGSLKAAMTEIADAYAEETGVAVERAFGPSGLLRARLEEGEAAEVFASANMKHPTTLANAGRSGPVALFARNRLCALTQAAVDVTPETMLAALLDPDTRVGTSTPKADPAGDYAFQVFDKAEALQAGAGDTLRSKALQLTGGPDSAPPPAGRNPYAWVMENDKADIFLTYCTNAVLAKGEVPALRIVPLPEPLAVGADYGLTVLNGASENAWRLAAFILSPKGQSILKTYGFAVAGVPDAT